MRQTLLILAVGSVILASCSAVQEQIDSLDFEFDLDAVLAQVRDCDALAEHLVDLVGRGAQALDDLATGSDRRIPETTVRETVDKITVSRFFDIAERIGCTSVEFRLKAIEDLRELTTESDAGRRLVDEILRELETRP